MSKQMKFMRSLSVLVCGVSLVAGFVHAKAKLVKIEYHGDSTVWGYASGSDARQVEKTAPAVFAQVLQSYARVEVDNRGVNGATACRLLEGGNGQADWNTQMRQSRTQYVILNHGINDQWQYPITRYSQCLRELAQTAKRHGKRVIFETPNPTRDSGPDGLDKWVDAMRRVAQSEGIGVIDQYAYLTDLLNGRPATSFAPDGLHPSDAVYEMKGKFAAQAFMRLVRF